MPIPETTGESLNNNGRRYRYSIERKKGKTEVKKGQQDRVQRSGYVTEGISFTIVENAVSEELPSGDLKKA